MALEDELRAEEVAFMQDLLDRYSEGGGLETILLDRAEFLRIVRKHSPILAALAERKAPAESTPSPDTEGVMETVARALYDIDRDGWLEQHPDDFFLKWDDVALDAFKDQWRSKADRILTALRTAQNTGRDEVLEDGWQPSFRPMDAWDCRDETVLLLVDYENGDHPLDDARFALTIGHNNDHNVGDGEGQGWQFAGWCWCQDCYTEGSGTPVGWLPLPHLFAAAMSSPPVSTVDEEGGGA